MLLQIAFGLLVEFKHVGLAWSWFQIVNIYILQRAWHTVRIPANVTGHYGDRDRFAHGLHAGESFVR